jgi:hypothetical protein
LEFVDKDTGAVRHAINWQFRVGDQVKLRVVNEMDFRLTPQIKLHKSQFLKRSRHCQSQIGSGSFLKCAPILPPSASFSTPGVAAC